MSSLYHPSPAALIFESLGSSSAILLSLLAVVMTAYLVRRLDYTIDPDDMADDDFMDPIN